MTPAIAVLFLALGAFVWACTKRRKLAGWIFLLLVLVIVVEGQQMIAQYPNYPHYTRQDYPQRDYSGCGAMGNGGPTSGGC